MRAQLNDAILWSSMVTRAAIALGIVFLMTTKPDVAGSLIGIAIFAVIGLAVARLTTRRPTPLGNAGMERAS